MYLAGIDGGQTSTRAVVAAWDGSVLGYGVGGPFDRFDAPGGLERNRAAIHTAIRSACAPTEVEPGAITAIGLGLTGFHERGPELPLIERILHEMMNPETIHAVGDYMTNLLGASGGGPGVCIISGGGSIAYGFTEDGHEERAGGMGYLLADEGSAYDIGLRALRAAVRASDGRGPRTKLVDLIREAFGVSAISEIASIVYRGDFSRERIAALAPLAARASEQEDDVARGIMSSAGEELARTTLACLRKLYTDHHPDRAVDVYPTGGVFEARGVLEETFRSTIKAEYPLASIRVAAFPPVVGSLILGHRASGRTVDGSWLERVAVTLTCCAGVATQPSFPYQLRDQDRS